MKEVTLVLDDGTQFHGQSFGYEKNVAGEVVFNTRVAYRPELCWSDAGNNLPIGGQLWRSKVQL